MDSLCDSGCPNDTFVGGCVVVVVVVVIVAKANNDSRPRDDDRGVFLKEDCNDLVKFKRRDGGCRCTVLELAMQYVRTEDESHNLVFPVLSTP